MSSQLVVKKPAKWGGLDYLRLGAVALVVYQHALSLRELDDYTSLWGVNAGQLGVGIFLGVSGLLAQESHRPPAAWLWSRLVRIYPAFWIAMVVSFILAGVSGYKKFDAWQVVSQLAGTGLFTHGDLVNQPTWFVSLLLLGYVFLFVARVVRAPIALSWVGIVVSASLAAADYRTMLTEHAVSFFAGYLVAALWRSDHQRGIACLIGAALFAPLAVLRIEFTNTMISLVLLAAALQRQRSGTWVRFLVGFSYEFYLVHGICLAGATRLVRNPWWLSLTLGLVAAVMSGKLLHWTVGRITKLRMGVSNG